MSAVTITYREVREWPGAKRSSWQRTKAPFKAHATKLWDLLDRELWKLNAREVVLSGYWRARDIKRDGTPYADARPTEPGIILEFTSKGTRYRFACDRFLVWLDNVDAIARSLEALRMVERYGVMSGQQYEGFKALPSQTSETMTTDGAFETIAFFSGYAKDRIMRDGEALVAALRSAKGKTHPDAGGSYDAFLRVQQAESLIQRGRAS